MKKTLAILLAVVMVSAFGFSACSKEPETDEPTEAAVATASITADEAKAIALEKLSIQETAAENLEVTETEYEGAAAFLVKFDWSGFDYEFTIDAASGKIVHRMFNGEEMAVEE